MARRGRGGGVRLMTTAEIAAKAQLPERRVRAIASMPSWDKVRVGDMLAFMRGCGFDPEKCWRHAEYLRRTLNLRKTKVPLAYAKGRSVRAPEPVQLVDAALGSSRSSASSGASGS